MYLDKFQYIIKYLHDASNEQEHMPQSLKILKENVYHVKTLYKELKHNFKFDVSNIIMTLKFGHDHQTIN